MRSICHTFFLSFVLFIVAFNSFGQLDGQTAGNPDTNYNYSYDDGAVHTAPVWSVSGGGSVISKSSNGTTYLATIRFTGPSTKTVTFKNGTTVLGTLSVTITCPTVAQPSSTFTTVNNCGNSSITRLSSPPAGVTWYWQNSSSSYTTNFGSASTLNLTSSGTYYLAASNNTYPSCWSTALNAGSVTLKPNPTITAANQTICSGQSTSVALSSTVSGTTYTWTVPTNTVGAINNSTPNSGPIAQQLTTGTSDGSVTYAVTGATSAGCTGYASPIVTVASITAGTVTPSKLEFYAPVGSYSFTASGYTTSSGSSILWQQSSDGSTNWTTAAGAFSSAASYSYSSITSTTYYRLKVTNGTCVTYSATVPVIVSQPPLIRGNGNNIPINGSSVTLHATLNNGAKYYSYQWIKAGTNISGATDSTYVATEPAAYSLQVTTSSTSPSIVSSAFSVYMTGLQPDTTVNTVITTVIRKKGVTNTTDLYAYLYQKDYVQSIQYLDALSRPTQTVALGQSPQLKDVVQPFAYDTLMPTAYLPYVSTTRNGSRRTTALNNGTYANSDQYLFYQQSGSKVANSTAPYATTEYESSPLGRVVESGAPGTDWQPVAGASNGAHTVKPVFHTNSTSFPVRTWSASGPTGYYASNTLAVSQTTDENGNPVIAYTDKTGQAILKRVKTSGLQDTTTWLETYYVYDIRGNVIMQVPPKVSALLNSGTAWSTTLRDTWCFQYTYDVRNRLVQKQVPGSAAVYYIYDPLGRLVLTQDGNLRTTNQWAFVKYDIKGRAVMSGLYTNATQTTLSAMQTLVNGLYTDPNAPYYEDRGTTLHGYTNQSFPTVNADNTALQILNVSYYDNYDFDFDGTADWWYKKQNITGEGKQGKSFGLPTGSKRLVMGTNIWLYSYVFYDRFGKVIQTRGSNHLSTSSPTDLATVIYDFDGKVLQTKTYHSAGGTNQYTIIQKNGYDSAGRLSKVYHNINGAANDQLVAQYEYNELGQVVDKKLHNTTGASFLQSVDYRYDIQGKLLSINNAQLTADGAMNDDTNDYFGMELLYNNVDSGLGNTASYNGNISAVKWKNGGVTPGVADQRSYKYSYDMSDKLLAATFQANNGSAWTKEAGTLNESMSYDHNGNMLSLLRTQNQRGLNGTTVTSTPQTIDNLTYTYATGNKLSNVSDGASVTAGFKDLSNASSVKEYAYDTLGSLTSDKNKGIDSIKYNVLGKPVRVKFSDGRVMIYTYDAAGNKLTMKTIISGTTTTTDYVGGFVYTNNALNFFSSPEGRVVKNTSGGFDYQYSIADNQGNTRILFTSATPTPVVTLADFDSDANDQSSQFVDVPTPIPYSAANHTPNGSKVIRLNQTTPVGPSFSRSVFPGDKIDLEVWSYYEASSGYGTTNLAGLVTNVATALVASTGGVDAGGLKTSGVNSAFANFGTGANQGDTQPAAFLNYILFDLNYKVMDAGWQVVPATSFAKQYVSIPQLTAKEAGYIFAYLSYEDQSNNYVYFDDFKVTVTPTNNIIQNNEYYPFGLQTANSWTRDNTTNNFLANGGTELNTTSSLYDLEFRNFDPVLGRMQQVDPAADKYSSLTPYNFSFNRPNMVTDVNGADPDKIGNDRGQGYTFYTDGSGTWGAHSGGPGKADPDHPFAGWYGGMSNGYSDYGMFGNLGDTPFGSGEHGQMMYDAQAVKDGRMSINAYATLYGSSVLQSQWGYVLAGLQYTVGNSPAAAMRTLRSIGLDIAKAKFGGDGRNPALQPPLIASANGNLGLFLNQSGPSISMSFIQSLYLLARIKAHAPDAFSFAGNGDAILLGGGTFSIGKIYGLTGSISGESTPFTDWGVGVGIDGGAGLAITEYYYLNTTGNDRDLTMTDFGGQRFSVNVDVGVIISGGIGVSAAPVGGAAGDWSTGMYIIGITYTYGVGFEGVPINGSVNYGVTTVPRK